jgi:hypothetical protein
MSKKTKMVLGVLLVGAVAYYLWKQHEAKENKTYSDSELDDELKKFSKQVTNYTNSKNQKGTKTYQEVYYNVKQIFEKAKKNNKDLSKKNVNKILRLLYITSLNQEGDKSQGVYTNEEYKYLVDFMGMSNK